MLCISIHLIRQASPATFLSSHFWLARCTPTRSATGTTPVKGKEFFDCRAQATNRFRSIKTPKEKRSSILRCYESASRMTEKTMVAESPLTHLFTQHLLQVFAGKAGWINSNLLGRTLGHYSSAVQTTLRPHVDNIIG